MCEVAQRLAHVCTYLSMGACVRVSAWLSYVCMYVCRQDYKTTYLPKIEKRLVLKSIMHTNTFILF